MEEFNGKPHFIIGVKHDYANSKQVIQFYSLFFVEHSIEEYQKWLGSRKLKLYVVENSYGLIQLDN